MSRRNYAPGGHGCATLIGCSLSEGASLRDRQGGIVARNPNSSFACLRLSLAPKKLSTRVSIYYYLAAMCDDALFIYLPLYRVLVCRQHRCAVYGLHEHLKRHHPNTPTCQRKELIASYEHLHRVPPADVTQPAPYGPPLDALQPAQDAFLCSSNSKRDAARAACGFISTSRAKMRQHVNQQQHVKLMRWSSPTAVSYQEHAAKL